MAFSLSARGAGGGGEVPILGQLQNRLDHQVGREQRPRRELARAPLAARKAFHMGAAYFDHQDFHGRSPRCPAS
jgi:hypothetical protein